MTEQCELLTNMYTGQRLSVKSGSFELKTSGNIKLCGYLKKKRNKVGGWRKMWFVLQDKLLLSYSSKEEYDNKLVSFKDVLNLMPGTMVRTLSGYRFTIETASNALYTFHCEDRHAYREWITTLLASLCASKSIRFPMQPQRVNHSYSMENLPQHFSLQRTLPALTHSCECIANMATHRFLPNSITRSTTSTGMKTVANNEKPIAYNDNCVRLPIAQKTATAKILERNGGVQSTVRISNKKNKQQAKFPAPITVDCCLQLCCNSNNKNNNSNTSNNNKQIDYSGSKKKNNRNDCKQMLQDSKVSAVITENHLKQQSQQQQQHTDYNTYNACSSKYNICNKQENVCYRKISHKHNDLVLNIKTAAADTVAATETTSCVFETSCTLDLVNEKLRGLSLADKQAQNEVTEPIYAVVNFKNKYAHRQQQQELDMNNTDLLFKRCNSYQSILAASEREREHEFLHKKSASCHEHDDIEAIYEDGDLLILNQHNQQIHASATKTSCVEENIYEPINVRQVPRKTLWRYITHLKVTPFLQLKSNKENAMHYESVNVAKVCGKARKNDTTKHLSTLRHKFGTHRRSMQLRMRNLCSRSTHYVPKSFFKDSSKQTDKNIKPTTDTGSNECTQKHKKKSRYHLKFMNANCEKNKAALPQKRFFYSLKHLRKLPKNQLKLQATTSNQFD